jgi:ergothioneine biosynthesis protein EgtB
MASVQTEPAGAERAETLAERYRRIRDASLNLSAPLAAEDQVVQTIPEVSPTKWHLAHVTWFFERFLLSAKDPSYTSLDERYHYLFNSYYYTVGEMYSRAKRGLLSRPTVAEVHAYRRHVDDGMVRLIERRGDDEGFRFLVELGLNHEQQHQELLLTDIKHVFFSNPLGPTYIDLPVPPRGAAAPLDFVSRDEGVFEIGVDANAPAVARTNGQSGTSANGRNGTGATRSVGVGASANRPGVTPAARTRFCFDNETPRHRVLVAAHSLANRLVTNADYREFIAAGGYSEPALWLSDGWALIRTEDWNRPLCWSDDLEREFTLGGWREIDAHAPVCHVSYYEADAFARWAGARLPSEAEWELAAVEQRADLADGNLLDAGLMQPLSVGVPRPAGPSMEPAHDRADIRNARADRRRATQTPLAQPSGLPRGDVRQLYGDVWEWTSSSYAPYPGFKPLAGSLGEYNGKFMCNQMVVRGGSCLTSREHVRPTYRSFFYPRDRWQMLGFRLAKDA